MSFRMSSVQFMTNYKSSLNKTYREQAKIMEQGDGTSIHRASDDPIGYSKLLRYNVSDSENEQYQKNVDNAISWMKTTDNAAVNISERMKTFSEKTVAAANSYLSEADFQSIAKEMFAQIEEIVADANTQQGDRYLFAGQKDTTEPFVLSHDTYERGVTKTLDSKQAAFFKGAIGDINATLYQFLQIEYTDSDTGETSSYYLDTQSGYFYTKDFVENGYKELIAQGYEKITDVDNLSTTMQPLAKTYAAGSISLQTVTNAWEVVNNASESDLIEVIRTPTDELDSDTLTASQKALREALKIIHDNDIGTVKTNLSNAKNAVINSLKNIEPEENIKYNYSFTVYVSPLMRGDFSPSVSEYNGVYTEAEAEEVRAAIEADVRDKIANNVGSYGELAGKTVNFYATKSSDATEAQWNTYDRTLDDLDTDTAITSGVTEWNSGTGKTKLINNIITAIDEYAESSAYTSVTNSDQSTDTKPSGDPDTTMISDNISQNILDTLKAEVPASTDRSDLGVTTNQTTQTLTDLADNVTATQVDDLARSEIVYLAVSKVTDLEIEKFKVSHAFNNLGLIRDNITSDSTDYYDSYLKYEEYSAGKLKVLGINATMFTVDSETHEVTEDQSKTYFKFSTIQQRMVNYLGDDNYISMVKMNGANDKTSDIVNLNGNDMFGCDIFDDQYSGNEQSGCAMLNNMLTVYTFTNACDEHWLSSDGVTLSDVAHGTVTIAETTLGSRLSLYSGFSEMLDNQSVTITNDITNVSGTDVAELATKLMEITTLYNMSLSLGGRILPQSLADYL